jgi:hypothetical protein
MGSPISGSSTKGGISMPFRPEKKTHRYRATITVSGPRDKGPFKKFRAALKKAVKAVRGKVKESKPRK